MIIALCCVQLQTRNRWPGRQAAREGALVTGVDFAPAAVAAARDYVAEFHPFAVVLGEEDLMVTDSYFDPGPFLHDEPGSYADPDARTTHRQSLTWHHGLGAAERHTNTPNQPGRKAQPGCGGGGCSWPDSRQPRAGKPLVA